MSTKDEIYLHAENRQTRFTLALKRLIRFPLI